MKDGRPYSYTVIRYIHDVVTAEFVNIGVILHVPSLRLTQVRVRSSMGRLRGIFPDLDRTAFTRTMRAVEQSILKFAKQAGDESLFPADSDAVRVADRALPRDDSSLQWSSPAGVGLTDDPSKTLNRLFERFVSRYDTRHAQRRTDEDIWRPVRQKLEDRNLAGILREKAIQGDIDQIVFKHAWKNGLWHVYEPLSFDLAEANGIKTKAREWLGHLTAVSDGTKERFKPHFIVGAPGKPELHEAYASALAILKKAPAEPEIFEEDQIDDLVSKIEDEVRDHRPTTDE